MVPKNLYLATKIKSLSCLEVKLLLEDELHHLVTIDVIQVVQEGHSVP